MVTPHVSVEWCNEPGRRIRRLKHSKKERKFEILLWIRACFNSIVLRYLGRAANSYSPSDDQSEDKGGRNELRVILSMRFYIRVASRSLARLSSPTYCQTFNGRKSDTIFLQSLMKIPTVYYFVDSVSAQALTPEYLEFQVLSDEHTYSRVLVDLQISSLLLTSPTTFAVAYQTPSSRSQFANCDHHQSTRVRQKGPF